MRYVLAPAFAADLDELAEWLAADDPGFALRTLARIQGALDEIARSPQLYQLRSEIGDDAPLAVVGHNVILFRIDDTTVRFERIVYGGRDLPSLFS